MFARVDYLKEKAPWLERMLDRRSAIGVLLLVTIFLLIGDGYELLTKEMPEDTFPAPVGPIAAPSAPHVAKSHNPAIPVELVDFESGNYASLQNNKDEEIFVMDLQVKQPLETQTWPLNVAIAPHKIERVSMNVNRDFTTIPRQADDWTDNYQKTAAVFGQNCLIFQYLSPHASALEMVRNYYENQKTKNADTEVDGVLHYRTTRSPKKLSTTVKLIAALERWRTCTPTK